SAASLSIISLRVAIPVVRQNRSKLAPTSCQASSTIIADMAADDGTFDVIAFLMALLSSRGFDTPSLQAQGEQRLPPNFNNGRDIPPPACRRGSSQWPWRCPPARYRRIGRQLPGRRP